MKKGKYLLVLGCLLFLVTGCKTKRLTCEQRIIDTEEVKVDQRISLAYKDKALKEGTFALTYFYKNNTEENTSAQKQALEEQYSIYKDKKGIEYYSKNVNGGLYFEFQAQIEDLSEEDKENLSIIAGYKDMQSAKEKLVQEGYTCK